MDSSPPDSSIHGISQARTLEWVAISFSRAFSNEQGAWAQSPWVGGVTWKGEAGGVLMAPRGSSFASFG